MCPLENTIIEAFQYSTNLVTSNSGVEYEVGTKHNEMKIDKEVNSVLQC